MTTERTISHPTSAPDVTASGLHRHTDRCWWNPDLAGWTCPTGQATTPEAPLVDVRDMVVVHGALLREFRLLALALVHVPPRTRRPVAAVSTHVTLLLGLLHHHHAGEDALLWPLLRERCSPAARHQLDVAEAQHAGIDASVQEVTAALEAWTSSPDDDRREALAVGLQGLHGLLDTHLDFEERMLLPLAASLLTEAEWHAIGEAAVAAMPKPVLPLVFGMFAYEGDPVVLRAMLQSAPALPRRILPRIAPRVYAARAKKVYGTTRP